jgi:hypothetical protein
MISLNHKNIDITTNAIEMKNTIYPLLNICIDNAPFTVKVNNDILVYNGQGEGDTKWKGWSWKLLLIKFVISNIKTNRFMVYYD